MGAILDVGETLHGRTPFGPGADGSSQAARGRQRPRMGSLSWRGDSPDGPSPEGAWQTSRQRGNGSLGHLLQGMQEKESGKHERVRDPEVRGILPGQSGSQEGGAAL